MSYNVDGSILTRTIEGNKIPTEIAKSIIAKRTQKIYFKRITAKNEIGDALKLSPFSITVIYPIEDEGE